jgi:arylsulfatase A
MSVFLPSPAAVVCHVRRLVFCLAASVFAASEATAAERLPNVVIVFTDDQGYGDVGVYGANDYQTPHLDQLAAEGRKFNQWYVSQPVCSASRASLLTGCYANRLGIHGALGPASRTGLNPDETTLAEMLKDRGYATGVFGKWHLGDHEKFLPLNHGFDEFFGIPYSNDMWPLHPTAKNYPPLPLIDGGRRVRMADEADQRMLTRWITARAVDFIGRHRDRPFFLYVPHPQPHVPLYASEGFEGKSKGGRYGDVIEEIDWSVGEILNALATFGLDENTLVVFTSDNGPWLSYGSHSGSAGPLREGKGTVWEGGVRVPCLMRWPGVIPAGSVCDAPAMTIDLLPTLAAWTGAELPGNAIDGKDIRPLITGEEGAASPHESYWFYYGQNELQAVLSGGWKLVLPHQYRTLAGRAGGQDGLPVAYGSARSGVELYHVAEDPGETENLAGERPAEVERLMKQVEAARADLGDSLSGRGGAGLRAAGRLNDRELAEIRARHGMDVTK